MKSNLKTSVLTQYPSIYQNQDYEKFNTQRVLRNHKTKLDKYREYDVRYSNYYLRNLWDFEFKNNSMMAPEEAEQDYGGVHNEGHTSKRPAYERISSFPMGDPRCFGRETAFYNRNATIEQHYLDHFNSQESNDWIHESLNEIDNLDNDLEIVYFGNEINYDDICKDLGESSNDEIDIEININEMKSFELKDPYAKKKSISFSKMDHYGPMKEEDESEEVSTSTVEDQRKSQDGSTRPKLVIDFNTPLLNLGGESNESTSGKIQKVGDSKQHKQQVDDNLDKFAIDFRKFHKKEDEANSDKNQSDMNKKIVSDDKESLKEGKGKRGFKQKKKDKEFDKGDMKSEVSEMSGHSPETINEEESEADKVSKIDDRATLTYVSEDKKFLITGTAEGFIHIWAFLQPHQSKEERDFYNSHFFEKQPKRGVMEGEEYEDGGEGEFEQNPGMRKLGKLSWSHMSSNPDVSFKAHDAEIVSLHITPKTFSNGKVDYVLVSTSFDRTVKVWRLSSLKQKSHNMGGEFNGGNGYNNKNKEVKINLLGWQEDPEDMFAHAVFIPNTKDKIMVTRYSGMIEKFKLANLHKKSKNGDMGENNMSSVLKVSTEDNYVTGSMSTNCNYYAVGGPTGTVSIYDVKTLNLLASFECRNRKGSNSKGKEVTGIEWNKKDDLILVTTLDSRIRLLLFSSDYSSENYNNYVNMVENEHNTGKKLIYVEKFKGHKNNNRRYKARFFGSTEQIVICPSESGEIYMWPITNPITHTSIIDGIDNSREKLYDQLNEEIEVKNNNYFKLKIENKNMLENLNIYNVCEWSKLLQMIQYSSESELNESKDRGGCLMFRRGPKNENPNPDNDILIVSSPNGSEIKYSLIDVRYFQQ